MKKKQIIFGILGFIITINSISFSSGISLGGFNAVDFQNGTTTLAIGESNIVNGAWTNVIGVGNNLEYAQNNQIGVRGTNLLGRGNTLSYTRRNNIFGDNMVIKGLESDISQQNNLIGYNIKVKIDDKTSIKNVNAIGSEIDVKSNNSIYLGNETTNANDENTGGVIGTVNTAIVGPLTYSGFQGEKSVGIVTVGSKDKERRVQNVAAGLIDEKSTDAINGSQLYAAMNNLGNLANSNINILGGNSVISPTGNITMTNIGDTGKNNINDAIIAVKSNVISGDNSINVTSLTNNDGSKTYDIRIDKTELATKKDFYDIDKNMRAGIAGVAAIANIPQINEAASNRYNIAVGVGNYRGEKAVALGFSGISDGGRIIYKATSSINSQKHIVFGVGMGYQFGKRDIEPNELDRFKAKLALTNSQKDSLAQELKETKNNLSIITKENEEIKKELKKIKEILNLK